MLMKVAVSGKGGVGKTLIAAGLARGFVERGLKTMAIDADSSPNLGLTLGLSTEETRKIVPITENKELVESKTGQDAGFRPATPACVDGMPAAKAFGQTTPFAALLGNVQDGIQDLKVRETDVAALTRQTVLDQTILCFGDLHAVSISRPTISLVISLTLQPEFTTMA